MFFNFPKHGILDVVKPCYAFRGGPENPNLHLIYL